MCVLGMAEEFKDDGIAVNALWPKTGRILHLVTCLLYEHQPETLWLWSLELNPFLYMSHRVLVIFFIPQCE